jgi:hypothetical protein
VTLTLVRPSARWGSQPETTSSDGRGADRRGRARGLWRHRQSLVTAVADLGASTHSTHTVADRPGT